MTHYDTINFEQSVNIPQNWSRSMKHRPMACLALPHRLVRFMVVASLGVDLRQRAVHVPLHILNICTVSKQIICEAFEDINIRSKLEYRFP